MPASERSPTARLLAEGFPALASQLDEGELEALAWELQVEHARRNDEVHRQGSTHPSLLFLLEGSFALRLGDEQTADQLGYLPEPTIVGEVSFFDGGPVTATILVCSRTALVLALEMEGFERLVESHPRAAAVLCRFASETLAARLRKADQRWDAVMGSPTLRSLRTLLRALFGLGRSAA